VGRKLLGEAGFITPQCMKFLEIHFHEALPHGDQIIKALTSVRLSPEEIDDCRRGAIIGAVLYLRMATWVFRRDILQNHFEGF
jgi:hypothetical protein